MTICKPRSEASGETKPADTLILDFEPSLWYLLWQPKLTNKPSLDSFTDVEDRINSYLLEKCIRNKAQEPQDLKRMG